MKYTLILLTLTCLTSPLQAQTFTAPGNVPGNTQDQRDPTIPSPEIQQRAQPTPEAPKPEAKPEKVPAAPAPKPVARSITSPIKLPPMALQSLVRSTENRCTATIRSGEESVTVSFIRGQSTRTVQLPPTQFAGFAPTIQRLADELTELRLKIAGTPQPTGRARTDAPPQLPTPANREVSKKPVTDEDALRLIRQKQALLRQALQPRQIDLSSSFSLNGDLYRVVDFSSDTLLVEQIPLGKYIIVR